MIRRTLVMALALATATISAQQQPARDNRTAPAANTMPSGTAVIGGRAEADDGRPVRFAHVLLIGTTTGIAKISSTDADGKFSFVNLPADRYTLGISKAPYLSMIAGAKRPGRPGTPIVVANGQKLNNVAVRMVTGGSITGVITDERGQPATGVMVGVLQWRMQNGERALAPPMAAGSSPLGPGVTATDDEGRYRIFGLVPGEYFVTAQRLGLPQEARPLTTAQVDAALAGGNSPAAAPPTSTQRYAPVYFPGTTRAGDAVPILVNASEERNNADFRLETVSTSRVEGTVLTGDGLPVNPAIVIMAAVANSVMQTAVTARVTPEGRFTIPNAQPGSYVFIVNGQGPFAGQFARGTIEVAGSDVSGVQLTMRPALSMNGRLAFDAPGAPSVAARRIPFRALSAAAATAGASMSTTTQTGTFTVTNLMPGRYVLGGPLSFGPTSDTMTWTLQSVIADERDVTDLPIEIAATAPKDVVVTYTDKWQELSGRLQSQSGAPVSDYTIIVFPEDKAYWFQGTRRIVTTRPGTDGRFILSGKGLTTLPPGKYLLAAVTDVARDEQFDPSFLTQIVPAAIQVTLGVGEKKVQDLAIR